MRNVITVDQMPCSFNHLGTHLFKKKSVHDLYVPNTVGAGDTVGNKIHKVWSSCSLHSRITLYPLNKWKPNTSTRDADQYADSLVTAMNSHCLAINFMVHKLPPYSTYQGLFTSAHLFNLRPTIYLAFSMQNFPNCFPDTSVCMCLQCFQRSG